MRVGKAGAGLRETRHQTPDTKHQKNSRRLKGYTHISILITACVPRAIAQGARRRPIIVGRGDRDIAAFALCDDGAGVGGRLCARGRLLFGRLLRRVGGGVVGGVEGGLGGAGGIHCGGREGTGVETAASDGECGER